MKEMPKKYDPKETEKKWQEEWEKKQIYAYKEEENKPTYTIDTPPPTISGKMHLGHAFSYTHEDIIARYKRMKGYNVFYPFGTDDNGLPTDKLVEKTRKIRSKDYPRAEYLKICHETIKELRPAFIQDWKNLGMSCDFEKSYSTISPEVQRISQEQFIDLYKKGLVEKKKTPVSWCPTCQTAIAQAEFENVEMTSTFNDIIFKSGEKELVIATTRPELLPACVALFYHPEDERYKGLKGKYAKVPLFDYEVPIMTDEAVDKETGTGLMMVCTFGDKEDIEKWHKYNLPLRIVFTEDGRMINTGKEEYDGLKIKEARKKILEDLEKEGLLIAKKPITHAVNVHERCGTEVEFLEKEQWYIKILENKEELIRLADKINWYPEHMKIRYKHWVQNLNWDWCISRQRHFGIPFPVWKNKKTGEIIIAEKEELPVDPTTTTPKNYSGNKEDLEPETDVMDTWATSSLTPIISLSVINKEGKDLPMSLRPQAHDIIRTWAFYTIVRSWYHYGKIPWENIMISGFVLDPKGNKMSKSKGNVIAPQDIMNKYSADALRYWASGVRLGDDMPFMEKDVATGQKTITKLWNASRFAAMQLTGYEGEEVKKEELYLTDAWILSKLQRIIKEATDSLEKYEYNKTKLLTDQFFWNTFCDNYLEIIKERIYNPDKHGEEKKKSAQYALEKTLKTILKLFAPIMPYVTEEIYQYLFKEKEEKESIHQTSWPEYEEELINEEAEKAGEIITGIISAVRKEKSAKNLSLKNPVKEIIISCPEKEQELINKTIIDLKGTTKTEKITYQELEEGTEITKEVKIKIII